MSPLGEVAGLVLEVHPPGCRDRDWAERFALELITTSPGSPLFERRRLAALRWLDGVERAAGLPVAEAVA